MSKNTIIIGAALVSVVIIFESVLKYKKTHQDTKKLEQKMEQLETKLLLEQVKAEVEEMKKNDTFADDIHKLTNRTYREVERLNREQLRLVK